MGMHEQKAPGYYGAEFKHASKVLGMCFGSLAIQTLGRWSYPDAMCSAGVLKLLLDPLTDRDVGLCGAV